jgi:signal transduction histidine kinase/ActR/RegA family two-component response regulator
MMQGPDRGSRSRDEHRAFLSTLPAARGERQLALVVVLVSVAIFLTAVPFAKVPLAPIGAFIPIYESALVISDLITAVLLFGQFSFLGSRALLVLASGYLFTAFMTVSHALTFPGLFAPTGLLGAGPQSTAWLYMFWHGGFPLLVVGYALLKDEGRETSRLRGRAPVAILSSVAAVLGVVGGLTFLATVGQETLPAIMRGNHYTPAMISVVSSTWVLSLLGLVILWWRRPHAVLDLWLMVVMCAWLFDIALAAVLNAGRFDLGFYAGRIYGLVAASFVLMVLLIENGRLYARLVDAHERIEAQNRSLEQTVRERTERLLQSEKIAAMGSLLAGVAHELNNPLAILSGQAQLLRETMEPQQITRRSDKIHEAADRCVRIVRNFLALARQRPPERADMRLNQVVQGAVELLAYELRTEGVEVVLDLAADVPKLWADSHQLHQVVVNLVANAQQAMRHSRGPRTIALTTRYDAGRARVWLDVMDTGPGIPPEALAKIFEPFFTTKPPGEGTGLGLSLCRGIVEEHGGTLAVESELGQGARFVIELPVLARPSVGRRDDPTEVLPPIGPKMILIVDDEPDIAAMLADALALDGHRTEIATNGAIALERLGQRPYDLVVSDTKMPVLSGEELYEKLQQHFPAMRERIIFLTGDLLSREKREFLERTGVPFLAKPCDLGQVRQLVHRTLATATGGRPTEKAIR